MENKKRGFYGTIKHTIDTGSFGERIVAYIFLFIIIFLAILFAIIIGGKDFLPNGISQNEIVNLAFLLFVASIVPIILIIIRENSVRNFRKENGLPINKNIEEDLIQMEIDEQIVREQKAYKKVTGSTDKNDINYWYDLFQKGAITKEEYEAKKRELL